MFDLGLWDDLLATAGDLRPQLEAGLGGYLAVVESYRAAVECWRGALDQAHQFFDQVLPQARKMALQDLVPALAAAVTLSAARGDAPETLRLAEEYEHALSSAPAGWYWGWSYVADIARACAALGDLERARRLTGAAEPALWRHRLEMQSARAAVAEAAGAPAADQLYTDAAAGWHGYGHVLEHGLALLGLGRCQKRAGHPDAPASLLAARNVFARLRAVQPLAETESWLGGYPLGPFAH
jgi:hypothetical protein